MSDQPKFEHFPKLTNVLEKGQLEGSDLAALDEIPDDAVSHWWNGEEWDFEAKVWIQPPLCGGS